MIIDCHVHLLPKAVRSDRTPFCATDHAFCALYSSSKARLASEADIIEYLDRSHIDKAVVFGFPWQDSQHVIRNNEEVWAFHDRFPDRIIPFAVLPASGGAALHREAERTLGAGFCGLGELAIYDGGWTGHNLEMLAPCLELATQQQVPVLIHINEPVGHAYPGKILVDFQGLLQLIQRYDELDFILAHWGGGVFFYALMPEVNRILSRTYLDTAASPYLYSPAVFDVACRIMGHERILFGSDFPLLPLQRYLNQLEQAGIAGGARNDILGGNAQRLLERDAPSPGQS